MNWQTVGVVAVTALTDRATFGPVASPLDQGRLWLRLTSVSAGNMTPLAFAIVGIQDSEGTQPLPAGRFYPQGGPAVVHLGPGPFDAVDGQLWLRPRAYNLRWLSVGLPARVWIIRAEVLGAEAITDPRYEPPGILRRLQKLFPRRGPVGSGQAWALGNE